MTLFDIDAQIKDIETEAWDEETGEVLNEELFQKLDALIMEREQKIENICLFRKNILSDAEQLKAMADEFYKRAKSAERRAESLKNYIQYALNGEKFKTLKVNVYYNKSKSVDITIPETSLPMEFQRIKVEADKTGIKKALEDGRDIDGCQLIEKQSIVIR